MKHEELERTRALGASGTPSVDHGPDDRSSLEKLSNRESGGSKREKKQKRLLQGGRNRGRRSEKGFASRSIGKMKGEERSSRSMTRGRATTSRRIRHRPALIVPKSNRVSAQGAREEGGIEGEN